MLFIPFQFYELPFFKINRSFLKIFYLLGGEIVINISVVYINLNEYERRNGYNILFTRDFKIVWTIYYKIYRIIELLYFQNAHYFIILGFIRLCYNLGVAKNRAGTVGVQGAAVRTYGQ